MQRLRALFLFVLGLLSSNHFADAQTIKYTPIPEGYDFPANQDRLLAAVKKGDQATLRKHTWMVFAGLTLPTRPDDPNSEALWETWHSRSDVFKIAPQPQQATRTLNREFERPRQLHTPGQPDLQAAGNSQLSQTLFNQEFLEHTRTNKLNVRATLEAINAGWKPETPVADRKIPEYPQKSMALKLVWKVVHKVEKTPLPIYDEEPRELTADAKPPKGWKRRVVVDPTRTEIPAGETLDIWGFPASRVVPLTAFYHFSLNADQVFQATAISDFPPKVGDIAILVGMHFTTKEIPNWVWATFWWHDNPEKGEFAKDRPESTTLKGPWRNYLMDVSYDMDLPKESDNTPNAVFNPWLEAQAVNGVNSNCMTCHRRASYLPESASGLSGQLRKVTRGSPDEREPIFLQGTKLDFLWSLKTATDAQ